MPRLKDLAKLERHWSKTKDWSALHTLSDLDYKRQNVKDGTHVPKKGSWLHHGSPHKLKKGQKLQPRGPAFYGTERHRQRKAVHFTTSRGEAKQYARESDTGGLNRIGKNKKTYGKSANPRFFSTKGYIYSKKVKERSGIQRNYMGANDHKHHFSYRAQDWDKRHTVRHKGKMPITKGEAIAGGAALGVVGGGAYFYYRHRKGKMERVRKQHAGITKAKR